MKVRPNVNNQSFLKRRPMGSQGFTDTVGRRRCFVSIPHVVDCSKVVVAGRAGHVVESEICLYDGKWQSLTQFYLASVKPREGIWIASLGS